VSIFAVFYNRKVEKINYKPGCRAALLMIKQCQYLRNYQPFYTTEKWKKLIIKQDEKPCDS